jgi:hypothetical protein
MKKQLETEQDIDLAVAYCETAEALKVLNRIFQPYDDTVMYRLRYSLYMLSKHCGNIPDDYEYFHIKEVLEYM